MSEPFVGEIKMFAGNFAPRGWALCDGQLLAISQNDTLFSLFGTIYGGDGRTSFGLPDMRGRIPIHAGTGPGLSPRPLGSKAGAESVTLTVTQLPAHSHSPQAISGSGSLASPENALWSDASQAHYTTDHNVDGTMHDAAVLHTGGSQGHNNIMPFVALNFIVALFGIYPSRNN